MVKHQDKKRKQDLGIFYTPQEVVDFIFEILKIWKNKEDKETKRWQSHKPFAHYPSVIDPACGEGIFLKKAVESEFTGEDPRYKVPFVWGVDLDGTVVNQWEEISILHMFHNNREKMQNHFFHQNGLVSLPKIPLIYKKKEDGLKQFDTVVGNPPYGGVGLQEITPEMEMALFDFAIWKSVTKKQEGEIADQIGLLGTTLEKKDKERLSKFPIEILFIDRFIQLAKPGGWIAIVIPDGILTNSNADYVREYVSKKARIEASISLPRNTFKNVGTSAKTSILFLRKLKYSEKPEKDYPVFLASIENINSYNFQKIIDAYKKFYNKKEKNMDKSQLVQITKDQNGTDVVMVRADKTLKELMSEKPSSRWDPEYWHPKWKKIYIMSLPTIEFKEFIQDITYGQVGQRIFSKAGTIHYLQVINIRPTGIDLFVKSDMVEEGSRNDPKRSRIKAGQILLTRTTFPGMDTLIGRCIVVPEKFGTANVSEDIDVITLKDGCCPEVICAFLKTKYGQGQINHKKKGTKSIKINFDEIKSIKIPVFPENIQIEITKQYKTISLFHNKAMEAMKKGDEIGYKTNLEIAEKMLKDLIAKTETVIRGEREDIV